MEIKFLKAGSGDCIIIHHKKNNVIIDGGNDSKYLLAEIDDIYNRTEVINLLIITHHDDDHIRGIIELLKHVADCKYNEDGKFIQKVVFNSPRLVLNKLPKADANLLSYRQAHDVEELLRNINTDWKKYTDESDLFQFEDLEIEILSPTEKELHEYSIQKGVYLSSDWKCDWKSPMAKLEPFINDNSQDLSISNRSSVVLNISCEGKKVLLTGDVTPDRLEAALIKLSNKSGESPISFDLIKLPHHGSYRSLNKKLLEKIKCSKFLISTNGKKHFLPNKRAILKILKFLPKENKHPIEFIFNYEEALNSLEITSKEKTDYGFKLIPNNKVNGFHF